MSLFSLTIQTRAIPVGIPIITQPSRIRQLVFQTSGKSPTSTIAGYTLPRIQWDQTKLFTKQKNRTEFKFDKGTLKLTLDQTIFLSSNLSPCAQQVWLEHEKKHARDNENILYLMKLGLRRDQQFANILSLSSSWRPVADLQNTQRLIGSRIMTVFIRYTGDMVRRRDTPQEYRHFSMKVITNCKHIVGDILKKGMSGQGIDVVQVALNYQQISSLPLLGVDGMFGPKTEKCVKAFQRHSTIGLKPDGIVGPLTKSKLGL